MSRYRGAGELDAESTRVGRASARDCAQVCRTGTDGVVRVDPNDPDVDDFFGVPTTTVSAAGQRATPLSGLDEPLFVAPDAGATGLAEATRDAYGHGETDYFEKDRDYETGEVEITPSDAAVEERDVVLVDDIIATGGTMSGAIEALHERDVGRVYACCVHPVLAGAARTKLAAAGVERVIGTDTLECAVSEVSVAPAVADALTDAVADEPTQG